MAAERRYGAVLANRQFRLLWIGQVVSLFGDGVLSLALPLLVIEAHRSDAELGLVTAARMAPLVVLLLLGGVITDRVSRRWAMLVADGARGATTLALGLLALTGHLAFGVLVAGAVVLGAFDALFFPASTAMIPDVVEAELLATANSLVSLSRTVAPLAGPVLAGLVAPKWALVVDAGTFCVSALFLAAMRATPRPAPTGRSMLHEVAEGFRYCRRTPWLWLTVVIAGFANAVVWVPSMILIVLLLTDTLHAPHWQTGVVLAIGSIGGGVGAYAAGRWRLPRRRVRAMWLAWSAGSASVGLLGLSPSAWVVAVLFFVGAPLMIYGQVVWESLIQAEVPRSLLGRVSSVDWLMSLAPSPIGAAAAGAVAGAVGVRPTLIVPAAVVTALSLVTLALVPSLTAIDRRPPAAVDVGEALVDQEE